MATSLKISPLRPNMQFTDKNSQLTKEAYDFLLALLNRVGGTLNNLNAATLQTFTWEEPGTIGATTPNSGKFTTFACNGKAPQTSYTVGTAVATTGATNSGAYGYTTSTQANDIVTKLNAVITALKNNGIIV